MVGDDRVVSLSALDRLAPRTVTVPQFMLKVISVTSLAGAKPQPFARRAAARAERRPPWLGGARKKWAISTPQNTIFKYIFIDKKAVFSCC